MGRWRVAAGLILGAGALFAVFTGWPSNHIAAPKICSAGMNAACFSDKNGKNQAFTNFLVHVFPPGSRAEGLRTELGRQGFVRASAHLAGDCSAASCGYADTSHELEYNWGGVPCSRTLRVTWSESSSGAIEDLVGTSFRSCL